MTIRKRYFLIALIAAISLQGCKLADLRTSKINYETELREPQAIEILEKTILAHRLDKLKEADTYEFRTRDDWKGMMAMMNPLPKDNTWMKMKFRPLSFDGQFQYLAGNKKEITYGIQSLKHYELEGEEAEFKKKEGIEFGIAAIQYLFELPIRLIKAPILKYAGTRNVEGTDYHLVFATWESIEPNKNHDQYLLYIHPDTYQLAFANYTIRAMYMPMPKGMYGSIRYEDVAESPEGIKYASTLVVQINKLKKSQKYAHKMVIEDLKINTFEMDDLYPDRQLKFLGDQKPVSRK